MNYVATARLDDNGAACTEEPRRVDLYSDLLFLTRGLANKSLGNQEAAPSREQMWHVIHATVAFTLDTP